MASSLADCHAKLHWEATLPVSGLVVLLRKPDLFCLLGIGELPIPSVPQAEGTTDAMPTTLTAQEVNRYTERIISEGVISPRFSDARDDQGRPIYSQTEYVHVSELETADRDFLSGLLFQRMGLTPGDATEVTAFRPDEQRQDDQSISAGV